MSQECVEKVLGRLLTDEAFRCRAAADLAVACREEGYPLTEGELRLVAKIDLERLGRAAGGLDDNLRRFVLWGPKTVSTSLPHSIGPARAGPAAEFDRSSAGEASSGMNRTSGRKRE